MDKVKHPRDNNNSKNTIIKLLTERILDRHLLATNRAKRNLLFHLESMLKTKKTAATDRNNTPLANWFSTIKFNDTDDQETGTDKKQKLIRLILLT